MNKAIKDFLEDTKVCITALEKLQKQKKISERSLGCLDTMLDVKDFLESLSIEDKNTELPIKEYKNVKSICVNIKENKEASPTCLYSIPDDGLVSEFSDKYEWDVITYTGLNLMKIYKKDFISVEISL